MAVPYRPRPEDLRPEESLSWNVVHWAGIFPWLTKEMEIFPGEGVD